MQFSALALISCSRISQIEGSRELEIEKVLKNLEKVIYGSKRVHKDR